MCTKGLLSNSGFCNYRGYGEDDGPAYFTSAGLDCVIGGCPYHGFQEHFAFLEHYRGSHHGTVGHGASGFYLPGDVITRGGRAIYQSDFLFDALATANPVYPIGAALNFSPATSPSTATSRAVATTATSAPSASPPTAATRASSPPTLPSSAPSPAAGPRTKKDKKAMQRKGKGAVSKAPVPKRDEIIYPGFVDAAAGTTYSEAREYLALMQQYLDLAREGALEDPSFLRFLTSALNHMPDQDFPELRALVNPLALQRDAQAPT